MNVIVTTTINAPTAEIRRFDAMLNWHLIVVGDRKTPEYKLERGQFVSWEEQLAKYPDLCKLVGPDNTQRGRMIAFLEARLHNPELVATIDDDCMPYPDWPGPIYIGDSVTFAYFNCKDPAFDCHFPAFSVPARGFPPQLRNREYEPPYGKTIIPLLQENLWDGQADIDAAFRFTGAMNQGRCKASVPYWSNAFSPVNTQNTIIAGSVLKDHCGEIPFVGHVGDIWAGYMFQAYHPNSTLYAPATVRHWQQRSYESLLKDLKDELFSYEYGLAYLVALKTHGPQGLKKLKWFPQEALAAIELYRSYFK